MITSRGLFQQGLFPAGKVFPFHTIFLFVSLKLNVFAVFLYIEMASDTSLMAEESFLCSICLELFNQPASIPCGHTFCLQCITAYWDTLSTLLHCPLCKAEFYPKPMLCVNIFINEMSNKFKHRTEKKSSSTPGGAGSESVLCNLCSEPKVVAVKSCLVCFMSYCQTHLEPHQSNVVLKKHKLIAPVKNLESRICKTHGEPLEWFCRFDQSFLCESCKGGNHKKHVIVTLEEEAQMRKTQIETEREKTHHMIQTRQKKMLEIQDSLEASQTDADKALARSSHLMTTITDYARRSHAELCEVIATKQSKVEEEAKRFMQELEEEILQIQQKNLHLNDVSLTDDHLTFLENNLLLTFSSAEVKDWSEVRLNCSQFANQEALHELETRIQREIDFMCDPTFKEKQRHAVDVTLHRDTANPFLSVSEDGKRVAHATQINFLKLKQEMFDSVYNVLAKEGFSSGKFYYEVEVKGKTQWYLGVAKESINRNGDIRLSPKNGYWTIWLRKGNVLTANAVPPINLQVRAIPTKVGVFVGYEAGQVTFYDVHERACIFSFTGCAFTEKLFPFFSPCASDGGRNSAPLIITPVTHTG